MSDHMVVSSEWFSALHLTFNYKEITLFSLKCYAIWCCIGYSFGCFKDYVAGCLNRVGVKFDSLHPGRNERSKS